MTKSDEKELFRLIVSGCPDGYVKDILSGITNDVINAIDSDFGFIDLRGMIAQVIEARQELETLQKQIREAQQSAIAAQYELSSIQRQTELARETARDLGSALTSASYVRRAK